MDNASAPVLHGRFDFLDTHHRGVARGGHGQRTVRRTVFHRRLRSLAFEEALGHARGETVAATHTVVDLEVVTLHRFVDMAVVPENRRPVVEGGNGVSFRHSRRARSPRSSCSRKALRRVRRRKIRRRERDKQLGPRCARR